MDLAQLTLSALDWPFVLDALAGSARTPLGQAAARSLTLAPDRAAALALYAAVEEVWARWADDEQVPLGGIIDLRASLQRASGAVLEPGELLDIGTTLEALDSLKNWLELREETCPVLWSLASPIVVDEVLLSDLLASFEEGGQLSGRRYPILAELRERITALTSRTRRTLESMLTSDDMKDVLMDRYVTERAGRFVLPMRATFKWSKGIVHGVSQSGETVFVEPAEVVAIQNEQREAEAQLEREERRILAELTLLVSAHAPEIAEDLQAATAIDLAVARAALGRRMHGIVPEVGDRAAIDMRESRHPILVLRDVAVVANDLAVDGETPCLVLTGPNTGGKTVALKTLGLACLFVRSGIPVPCAEGSRVDFFSRVMAMVGDLQTVEADLSTFSGQIELLKRAMAEVSEKTLVLVDELGAGTDPAQGAALARAILERIVDAGARVVTTTHFAELRALPDSDPRFVVAAAEFASGRPTFHITRDVAGGSHALEVARRLGLEGAVLDRAQELLHGAAPLAELLAGLEGRESDLAARERDFQARERSIAERTRSLEERLRAVEERKRGLEAEVRSGLDQRLRSQEDELKQLIARLQEAPNLRDAGDALAAVRDARARNAPPPPVTPPTEVEVGQIVLLRRLGAKAKVVAILGDDKVEVDMKGLRSRVDLTDLDALDARGTPRPIVPTRSLPPPEKAALDHPIRLDQNTCDLRGMRVDEAIDAVVAFVDRLAARGDRFGFVLHGHGTGALKQAVRTWAKDAPYVRTSRPASESEGGDAFTVLEV